MIRLYFFILLIVFLKVTFVSAIPRKNYLKPQIAVDTVNHLIDTSVYLRNVSLAKSIVFGQKAIRIAALKQDVSQMAICHKTQGVNFYYCSNIDSALYHYQKSIPLFHANNQHVEIGKVKGNIGILYKQRGLYDEALKYYLDNQRIFKEENYIQGLGNVYNNLGNLYKLTGKTTKALEYYKLAADNFNTFKKTHKAANIYSNMGVVYAELKDFKKSVKYYHRALKVSENQLLNSKIFLNIGYQYHQREKIDSAIIYYKRAERIRTRLGYEKGLANVKLQIGDIYLDKKQLDIAKKYLTEAYKIVDDNEILVLAPDILFSLSELYRLEKNYKKALKMQTKAIVISDSLKKIETKKEFNDLIAKYEAEKKQKKLELLKQRSEIQQFKIAKRNLFIFALIVLILLGLAIILIIVRNNKLTSEHKISVLRQKMLLTQMNPHFIFNSLTAIQLFILENKNIVANNYLSKLASLVRNILENSQKKSIKLSAEINMLKEYMELQQLRFDKKIKYVLDIDENIDMDSINIPPMLAQPFVENSFVHGKLTNNPNAEIRIKIALTDKNRNLLFQIEDNGIGIDATLKNNKEHQSLATDIANNRIKIYNYNSSKKMSCKIIDLKHIDKDKTGTRVTYITPIM